MNTPIYDAILRRRSVRSYQDTPVERDALIHLVKAGAAAPSATNRQPWEFVVVTDPTVLEKLRHVHAYSNYQAPAAIVVCGNMERAYKTTGREFWIQDCSAATQNILLAALDLGLGTCWIGGFPLKANLKKLAEILALPEHVVPLGTIYVGYPAAEPEPRTQYTDAIIHWEQF